MPGRPHEVPRFTSGAPEQAIGAKDLDARSDLFSLGVMMYETLTGSTPNGHLDCLGALVMAICSQPAPPVQGRAPWVSAEVTAVVHKALAVQPSDRFPSAESFQEALVALLVRGDTTLRSDMLVPMTERETLQVATRAAASLERCWSPSIAGTRGQRSSPRTRRGRGRGRGRARSDLPELLDELPVGDQPLAEQDREQRRHHRLPLRVLPEHLRRVRAV